MSVRSSSSRAMIALALTFAFASLLGTASAACSPACSGGEICLTNTVNTSLASCQGGESLATDGAYTSLTSSSVVFAGLGQPVTLKLFTTFITVIGPNNPAWTVLIAINQASVQTLNFPCNNFVWETTGAGLNQGTCTLPAYAVGGGYKAIAYDNTGAVQWESVGTASFQAPIIKPLTLRARGQDPGKPYFINVPTSAGQVVQFGCQNCNPYYDANVTIGYGNPAVGDSPFRFNCTLQGVNATNLVCLTEPNSMGVHMLMTVRVGNQQATSVDEIIYPYYPTVSSVNGCNDVGNATVDCTTEGSTGPDGPQKLTILGSNFYNDGIKVEVNGADCGNVEVQSTGRLRCNLPESAGNQVAVVVTSYTLASDPQALLSYAVPSIGELISTGCTRLNVTTELVDCSRTDMPLITIIGRNFGSSGATVLIGSSLCDGLSQGGNVSQPHRYIVCTIPQGTGVQRPILLLQSGGGIGQSNSTLSYLECVPGYRVSTGNSGLDCTPCDTGSYSAIPSAQQCNQCLSGKYSGVLSAASSCSPCAVGTVSASGQSSCTNCTAGSAQFQEGQGVCTLCSFGEYSARNGSASCTPCPVGTHQSVAGSTHCLKCEVGTANNDEQQATCPSCVAGYYAPNEGSTGCTACEVGKAQESAGSGFCHVCDVGTSATAIAQPACTQCPAGTYGDNETHSCIDCAAGRYQGFAGRTSCPLCLPGFISIAKVAECSQCNTGTMSPRAGSSQCYTCPPKSTNNPVFTLCICEAGYYATRNDEDMKCNECPVGAECELPGQTLAGLVPRAGYWRVNNESLIYLQCLQTAHCEKTGCASHRTGPICAVCEEGYHAENQGSACTACPSRGSALGGTIGFTILIVCAVIVVLYGVWRSESQMIPKDSPYTTLRVFTAEDRARPNYLFNVKILFSYVQIATSLMAFVSIPWPSYFQTFINAFNFINLNFLPWGSVQCVASVNFYTKLLLVFILPMIAITLIAAIPYIVLSVQSRLDYSDDPHRRAERKEARQKIIKLVVFALFLMYPSVSSTILSFFICRTVNGTSYLVADFTLTCGDNTWNSNLPLAIVALLIYPIGIPAFFLGLLYRNRYRLKDPDILVSLAILYEAYDVRYWWWELCDMLEKLILTSILGFFKPEDQCWVGMLFVTVYLMILLVTGPYIRRIDDRISQVVQIHLFLILCIGLVLQQSVFIVGSLVDILASFVMFLVLTALLAVMVVHAFIFVRKYVRNQQRAALLKKLEAEGGGGKKFVPPTKESMGLTPSGNTPPAGASGAGGTVSSEKSKSDGSGNSGGDGLGGSTGAPRASASGAQSAELSSVATDNNNGQSIGSGSVAIELTDLSARNAAPDAGASIVIAPLPAEGTSSAPSSPAPEPAREI